MKRQLLLSLFFVTFVPNVGVACTLNVCEAQTGAYGGYTDISTMPENSCLSEVILCGTCNGQNIKVRNCIVCDAKYELYEATATISGGVTVKYNACRLKTVTPEQPECDVYCGDECNSTKWQELFNGVEYRVDRQCNQITNCCIETEQYRCMAGFYGSSDDIVCSNNKVCLGCVRCPEAKNIFTNKILTKKVRGTSVAGKNSERESCYLPTGTYYMKSGEVKIKNTDSSMCTY